MTCKIEGCGFPWYMDGKGQDVMDRVISGKWPISLETLHLLLLPSQPGIAEKAVPGKQLFEYNTYR